jgi:mRNA interferase MazF
MMANPSITKNRIVLVPFPFDDLSGVKPRPALCLTDPVGAHDHVVFAFITSRVPPDLLNTGVVLDADAEWFGDTGLRVQSTIRLHRLVTLTARFIKRELGELPRSIQEDVSTKLKRLFTS